MSRSRLFEVVIGCFSPSVPVLYRKIWVEHGGKLVHSEEDFYKASFYFCTGMKDDWLEPLLARGLIVLHPAWIMESVEEGFRMDIVNYVLDDSFDIAKIDDKYNIEYPAAQYDEQQQQQVVVLQGRKRGIDQVNTSISIVGARPRKKQRVSGSSLSPSSQKEEKKNTSSADPVEDQNRTRRRFFSSDTPSSSSSPVPFIAPVKTRSRVFPIPFGFWNGSGEGVRVEELLARAGKVNAEGTMFVPGARFKGREMHYLGRVKMAGKQNK